MSITSNKALVGVGGTPTRQIDQSILDTLKKLNEKLDKQTEQQEELRKTFEKLKTRSSPRNVRFEDRDSQNTGTITQRSAPSEERE